MFSTFAAIGTGSDGGDANAPKPKRRQVLRACDTCRIKRSKCDDSNPCSTCVTRGWVCSRSRSNTEPKTLGAALIQINALEERIRKLEATPNALTPPPSASEENAPADDPLAAWSTSPANKKQGSWVQDAGFVSDGQSEETPYFGTLSTMRFISRIKNYIATHPERSPFENDFPHQSLPNHSRAPRDVMDLSLGLDSNIGPLIDSELITRGQQWHLVNHFWQSYHPLLPILCEKDFTADFEASWMTSNGPQRAQKNRTRSALFDIVIAICALQNQPTQHDRSARASTQSNHSSPSNHESQDLSNLTISAWHYRRCRQILEDEIDDPTVAAVQSHLLLSVYLYNVSRQSAAYNALGNAVSAAYSLGLHLNPSGTLTLAKQELRRRIWWSLYILDRKLSIELGRPTLVSLSEVGCRLPAHDAETARLACLRPFASAAGMTWLTYTVEIAKLVTLVQQISQSFDPQELQAQCPQLAAEKLQKKLSLIKAWVDGLPDELRLSRSGGEESMSTDISSIEMDFYAPQWLQKQKIFLEIAYHESMVFLLRPLLPMGVDTKSLNSPANHLMEVLYQHSTTLLKICQQLSAETNYFTHHPELSSVTWSTAMIFISKVIATPASGQVDQTSQIDSLDLVLEILQHTDNPEPNALRAFSSLRKPSIAPPDVYTPQSLNSNGSQHASVVTTQGEPSATMDNHSVPGTHGVVDALTMTPSPPISDDLLSYPGTGQFLGMNEWSNSAQMMNSMNTDLWMQENTWLRH